MIEVNEGDMALIEGSIRKWEDVVLFHKTKGVEGSGDGCGSGDCPLCCKYNWYANRALDRDGIMCDGCPIRKDTGMSGCYGTPYVDYATLDDDSESDSYHEESLELATNMLNYLVKLKDKCKEV